MAELFLFVQVLADLAEVLTPLAEATELLTTESTPAAGAVYYLLKELAQDLAVVEAPEGTEPEREDLDCHSSDEEDVSDTDTDRPDAMELLGSEYDSPIAARLKRTIWTKLKARFSLEENGQPEDEVCRTCPLMISAFCDPRYLEFTFQVFILFIIGHISFKLMIGKLYD